MVELTDEQVASYREDGFVVVEELFDDEAVARMREDADDILELTVNSSLANDRKSRRLDVVEDDDGEQMVRKVQPVDDLSLTFTEVEEEIREAVGQLMDDEAALMEEKLNYKEPLPDPVEGLDPDRATSAFPVHNDWAYYKAQDYPQGIVSAAVMVDDNTAEKGPLHVWPGSHEEHREHEHVEGLGLQVPGSEIEGTGEDVLAPAGTVVFFSSLLVHSSRPNSSGKPRRLMIYSHYPESEGEMAFDERNGPTRFHESPWEWEYQRKKEAGEYVDEFEAPRF
ncbi:MAG: phytanoyl-CoA dioxygenase family protein [Halobacteriaceae archaeon]